MLVKKSWMRVVKNPAKGVAEARHVYTGWFLLGLIPVFVRRETTWRYWP